MAIDDLISKLEEKMANAQLGPFYVSSPEFAYGEQTLNTIYIINEIYTYEEKESYTLSNKFGTPGWETDGGYPGYGLTKANAEWFAEAANAVPKLIKFIKELKGT